MKTRYVLGLIFSEDRQSVVLIRKNKPDWQRGKLNGIGGKIEPSDSTPYDAMQRESKEECGVFAEWTEFCKMTGELFEIHVFKAFDQEAFVRAETQEAETIVKVRCENIARHGDSPQVVTNLPWLVWMALDHNNGESLEPFYATVEYKKGLL